MNSTAIALLSVACIFSGTLIGLALSKFVPSHHLSPESRDAVKVGAGMISMMSALVLGLLVSSSKNTYDSTNTAIVEAGAKAILLDRTLAAYGPDTRTLRTELHERMARTVQLLWPEEQLGDDNFNIFERSGGLEQVVAQVRQLKPQTEAQRVAQQDALELCKELLLSRWLQIEQAQTTVPTAFLVVLLFWLTMLYLSFGLLAPRNATVIAAMFVGALAIATALFLILEMNRPMTGTIKVSSAPLRKALEHIGR